MQYDQQSWFEPKETAFCDFIDQVWIKETHVRMEAARKMDETVFPADSVSVVSRRTKSSKTAVLCAPKHLQCLRAELDKAALMAQARAGLCYRPPYIQGRQKWRKKKKCNFHYS